MSTALDSCQDSKRPLVRAILWGPKGAGKSSLLARLRVPCFGQLESEGIPTEAYETGSIGGDSSDGVHVWDPSGDIKYDAAVSDLFQWRSPSDGSSSSSDDMQSVELPNYLILCIPCMMPVEELKAFMVQQTFACDRPKLFPTSPAHTKVPASAALGSTRVVTSCLRLFLHTCTQVIVAVTKSDTLGPDQHGELWAVWIKHVVEVIQAAALAAEIPLQLNATDDVILTTAVLTTNEAIIDPGIRTLLRELGVEQEFEVPIDELSNAAGLDSKTACRRIVLSDDDKSVMAKLLATREQSLEQLCRHEVRLLLL